MKAFEAPFALDGKEVFVQASIGIATSRPEHHGDRSRRTLLRNADIAMYIAKERGQGALRGLPTARCTKPRSAGSSSRPTCSARSTTTSSSCTTSR